MFSSRGPGILHVPRAKWKHGQGAGLLCGSDGHLPANTPFPSWAPVPLRAGQAWVRAPGQCHCRRRPPCSADPTCSGLWFQPGPCPVLSVGSRCPPVSTSSRLRAPPGVPCPVPEVCVDTPFFSLVVHGSVLSLASSASSTYSSVRAPPSPPFSLVAPAAWAPGGEPGLGALVLGSSGSVWPPSTQHPSHPSEDGEPPGPRARPAPWGGEAFVRR